MPLTHTYTRVYYMCIGIKLEVSAILTTKEISQMLGVSEETVRRWIRTKELKAIQEGKSYLVDRNDLNHFVNKKAKEGTATSIGKMALLLPIVGGVVGGASSVSKFIKMINSKGNQSNSELLSELSDKSNAYSQSMDEIDEYIATLKRQKQKLDLQYQMDVLQIEEDIEMYQKVRKDLEQK
ncbi:helix-turn-helix domain-containing protein [Psychrobacillus sp. FSL K6-1267]|uniref:helix-turn-helix domain-containing protein n=1 Tax=Psychrobacillus sp. FSL K6-1267 TaxID=2921543 RepID=UPI0030F6B5E6